jgi:hypothetical protein
MPTQWVKHNGLTKTCEINLVFAINVGKIFTAITMYCGGGIAGDANWQQGGPAQKMPFFHMVCKPFVSVLIYSTRCEYDILKVLLKIDQNPPVGCVKLELGDFWWAKSLDFTKFCSGMSPVVTGKRCFIISWHSYLL